MLRDCPKAVSALARRSDAALLAKRVNTTGAGAVRLRSDAATLTSESYCSQMRATSTVPVNTVHGSQSCQDGPLGQTAYLNVVALPVETGLASRHQHSSHMVCAPTQAIWLQPV